MLESKPLPFADNRNAQIKASTQRPGNANRTFKFATKLMIA